MIPLSLLHAQLDGSGNDDLIMEYFSARIVIVDYLIFAICWMCGWEAASRYRRAPERLEELLMTPLQPKSIGAYFMGGGPVLWFYGLIAFSVVEAFLFYGFFLIHLPIKAASMPLMLVGATIVPFSLIVFPLIALFQLETVRIAYWMFARAAITRTSLFRIAAVNFLLIPIYVYGLTVIGGIVTALAHGALQLIGGRLFAGLNSASGSDLFAIPLACLAPVPGLLLVLFLKRAIANAYSVTFEQTLLYHSWWGSSERDHPASYPRYYHDHYLKWRHAMSGKPAPITPPSRLSVPPPP